MLVVVWVPRVSAQNKLLQARFMHMFAPDDDSWKNRECRMTQNGEEYIGLVN